MEAAYRLEKEMIASADDPLSCRWWMQFEKPWQVLAICQEIAAALRHPGGPDDYESAISVHMDGSCNGLQHFAALGLDEIGGKGVNLCPGDEPQDVYTEVLEA